MREDRYGCYDRPDMSAGVFSNNCHYTLENPTDPRCEGCNKQAVITNEAEPIDVIDIEDKEDGQ